MKLGSQKLESGVGRREGPPAFAGGKGWWCACLPVSQFPEATVNMGKATTTALQPCVCRLSPESLKYHL